ncbi:putative type-1 restriction enzyme specificity protein MPN_089 [Candidatus Mycoplasma haematohominis]|uniref:Putative type-1 restriction enzyme specificity protein MPN_089 n=1 Tax=Candidatus Mycoplasma haematohominis TaxID=1494318 RepID=A0A478FRK0_9MOLU|nr:putative type-1 restriction enzyme specificity protein MPN_089 [Candidatus Mycoplasma haemohominis]
MLEEIATEVYRGSGITKSQIEKGKYPCIRYGEIYTTYDIYFNKCISSINPELINNIKYCEYGSLLITSTGENLKDIGKSCVYLGQEKIIVGNGITIIKHNQNPKYLSYALSANKSKRQKMNLAQGVKVFGLSAYKIQKIKIPLPPLEIQEQISEILDVLRELVRELETELKLRKKQYRYYLNKLISDVIEKGLGEYKTLGEIATKIYRGDGIKKEEIKTNQYPCIHYSEIYTNYEIWFDKCISSVEKQLIKNPKYCEYGDLLFAISSVMAENISKSCTYLGKEKIIVGGDIVVLKHSQNAKYISYALSTNHALNQKIKHSTEGTVSHISTKAIKKLKIPLPPLEIQEQITNALDHLRELCEDLEKGIPKEIELANKRYEYYRDLLITGEN